MNTAFASFLFTTIFNRLIMEVMAQNVSWWSCSGGMKKLIEMELNPDKQLVIACLYTKCTLNAPQPNERPIKG